jgi:hypothetical protein
VVNLTKTDKKDAKTKKKHGWRRPFNDDMSEQGEHGFSGALYKIHTPLRGFAGGLRVEVEGLGFKI